MVFVLLHSRVLIVFYNFLFGIYKHVGLCCGRCVVRKWFASDLLSAFPFVPSHFGYKYSCAVRVRMKMPHFHICPSHEPHEARIKSVFNVSFQLSATPIILATKVQIKCDLRFWFHLLRDCDRIGSVIFFIRLHNISL